MKTVIAGLPHIAAPMIPDHSAKCKNSKAMKHSVIKRRRIIRSRRIISPTENRELRAGWKIFRKSKELFNENILRFYAHIVCPIRKTKILNVYASTAEMIICKNLQKNCPTPPYHISIYPVSSGGTPEGFGLYVSPSNQNTIAESPVSIIYCSKFERNPFFNTQGERQIQFHTN